MNDRQAGMQIQKLLRDLRWEDNGSFDKVFHPGSVVMTVGPTEQALASCITPIALIAVRDATADPRHGEDQGWEQQMFAIRLITMVQGDALGENALRGANRNDASSFGQGKGDGRGILEVQAEVVRTLKRISGLSGMRAQVVAKNQLPPTIVGDGVYRLEREIAFMADCTSMPFYHEPTNFRGSLVTGTITFNWTLAPARFDRYAQKMLRVAGATPTTNPNDPAGVEIAISASAVTITDAPGSGTWSYSLWASYDDWHETPSQAQRFSTNPATYTKVVP